MNAFDTAWLVVKAPLDLNSIREIGPEYTQALAERRALLDELSAFTDEADRDNAVLMERHGINEDGTQGYGGWGYTLDNPGLRDRLFHATHVDRDGIEWPMVAYGGGFDDGIAVKVFPSRETQGVAPSPFAQATENPIGHLRIYGYRHSDPFDDMEDRGRYIRDFVLERDDVPEDTKEAIAAVEDWWEPEMFELLRPFLSDYAHSGSDLAVQHEYQRRGIGEAMRDLARELEQNYGMEIDNRPDPVQSWEAKQLWSHNQEDPYYRQRMHEIKWRGLRERMEDEVEGWQ